MKITFTALPIVLLLSLTLFNFTMPDKKFTPPGTVMVNDTLFWDETEISNIHWQEYVFWNKKSFGETSEQYKNTLADTSVWLNLSEEELQFYHNHPKFRDYPVVGITFQQAVDYCKWRTEIVKKVMATNFYKKEVLPREINYRLPTKAEWEFVAKAGYSEKTQKLIDSKKYKGYHLSNLKVAAPPGAAAQVKYNPDATITAPAKSFFVNRYGMYNLFGNVSEMISEKGISKGGGWNDLKTEVTVEKDFTCHGATAWTGFRCVCEVKWK